MTAVFSEEERKRIEHQLEALAASEAFAQTPQLVNFLAYVVAAELDGTGKDLNQSRIAIDVMGRTADFDATTDSIVRVEAGRLRSKLREYYAGEGAGDTVRFEIPKGRYNPKIQLEKPSEERGPVRQQVRFLKAKDGATLAYAISGSGPPLVKGANWLSHLEFDHQSPVWRHWWRDLSSRHRLIRYDARGCGLSDWNVQSSFEHWVEDLEAVVDHLGLERFPLLGISQCAAVAIAYAVKHPERVSHLILYGGYLQGRLARSGRTAADVELANTLLSLIRVGWGREDSVFRRVFASLFIPDADADRLASFDALQRASTSPEIAEQLVTVANLLDVTALAGQVRTPTLVLHARDELLVPANLARELASSIPNARLVLLEGRNHIIHENEPAWPEFLREVDEFLAE